MNPQPARRTPRPVLDRRRAGILLHITSLPGAPDRGDLGPDAYRFIDFLAAAGIGVWQTLPLGPTHGDCSPYLARSVHAGNPLLIGHTPLIEAGWVTRAACVPPADLSGAQGLAYRYGVLAHAWRGFRASAIAEQHAALADFVAAHAYWLEDYALYEALRREHGGASWVAWPAPLRDRDPAALTQARARFGDMLDQVRFEQFMFFRQWERLKQYANARDILLFGDMPIFVAHDSADVWAQRAYFDLDAAGAPRVVAGVPPDYFSATGQRWGNPHYRWSRMQADGFRWWRERLRTQLRLFDLVRIDHFRGFEAYWEIPAASDTAIGGHWVKAPGAALFAKLHDEWEVLPLVAEDLGYITPEVHALREAFGLPGMKILQFAFDGGADNPYLPHRHEANGVVYTGTHDNDTTLGWFEGLDAPARRRVLEYLGHPGEPMPWPLIRCALASVARLAVVPLQDVLGLGRGHRMNTPGVPNGNWRWRFQWDQISGDLAGRLRHMVEVYGRCA